MESDLMSTRKKNIESRLTETKHSSIRARAARCDFEYGAHLSFFWILTSRAYRLQTYWVDVRCVGSKRKTEPYLFCVSRCTKDGKLRAALSLGHYDPCVSSRYKNYRQVSHGSEHSKTEFGTPVPSFWYLLGTQGSWWPKDKASRRFSLLSYLETVRSYGSAPHTSYWPKKL